MIHSLAAPQVKHVRGTAEGMEVAPVLSLPEDLERPDVVRARAMGTEAYVGTLVSPDGAVAAIHANFDLTPELPGYRQVHAAVLDVVQRSTDGSFEYRLAGPVVFLSHLTAYAARIGYVFPLALVVIGLVHYHAFRTIQGLVLPLVTGVLSVVWSLGLMGLAAVPFDPYNVATPILILAVGAGHAVQMLKRFYEEFDRGGRVDEAIVASLARVGPVLIAAGLVASLSFCSLALFKMATIRAFGLLSGFGILSALVIELSFIPAARAVLPAPRRRERDRESADHPLFDRLLRVSARLATQNPRGVVWAAAGVALAAAGLASLVRIDTSYKRAFGDSTSVRRDDASINEHLAGTNTLVLLVDGGTAGTLEEPTIMRAIDALGRRLEAEPGVGKVVSYTDFVPRRRDVSPRRESSPRSTSSCTHCRAAARGTSTATSIPAIASRAFASSCTRTAHTPRRG
jgi:predicted RND superfamily exporter protein